MTISELDLLNTGHSADAHPTRCCDGNNASDTTVQDVESKHILVLTRSNTSLAAIRGRLRNVSIKRASYRLATVDEWALQLIGTIPPQADQEAVALARRRRNCLAIRMAAYELLKSGCVVEPIAANYSHLLVDKHQDYSLRQEAIVYYTSMVLPSCAVGEQLRAIIERGDDSIAD